MNKHFRFATVAAGALALGAVVATPAGAAGERFSEWDADRSGTIDRDEFQAGVGDTGYYDEWRGGEAALTRQEWRRQLGEPENFGDEQQAFDADQTFDAWDADQDERLKEHEMGEGWFQTYDRDRDEDLTEDEFGMFESDADEQGWFD